jgi:predicted small metal-binding protein
MSKLNCELNAVVLRGSFWLGCGWDIDASHDTEIKPRICENTDSESMYNKSHLYKK